jgi:ABC-type lipoprotein release transport system permease subunit
MAFMKLTWKMLIAQKKRFLYMLIGVMLGTMLLTSFVLLGEMIHASLQKQRFDQYGYTDVMVGYRAAEQGLTPEQIEQIAGNAMVRRHAQILASPRFPGFSLDLYVVGADNSDLAKAFYKFTQDLRPYEIVLSERLAHRWNANLNESVTIPALSVSKSWIVREIIPDRDGPHGPVPDIAIFHLQSLQETIAGNAKVNLLLIELAQDRDKQLFSHWVNHAIDSALDVEIVGNTDQENNINSFLATGIVLGIMVLFASGFVIFSSFSITVRQRKKELALVRMIGGSPEQLKMMVLAEASIIAVIGTFFGSLAGIFVTKFTMHGLARYFEIPHFSMSVPYAYVVATAIGIALFIFLIALLPAFQASKILPVEFLHEILSAHLPPRKMQKWIAAGLLLLGVLCIATGRRADPVSGLYALSYLAAGLLISGSIYLSTPFWIAPVLRRLAPLLERIMGIEAKMAVQNLIFHRAQSTLAIAIMGLSMTLIFPVVALFTWAEEITGQQIEANYVSDIVVWSNKSMSSTLPLEVQDDLQRIPGVQTAIAVSTNLGMVLVDYDFSKSNPKWVKEKSDLSQSYTDEHQNPVPERQVVRYKRVQLHPLVKELHLPVPQDIDLENVGLITAHYADMLGVKVGDTLDLIIPRFKTEPVLRMQVTIAAVLDTLYANEDVLVLDWNNDALKAIEQPKVFQVLLYIDPARKELVEQHLQQLQMNKYSEIYWSDKETELQKLSDQLSQRMLIITAAFILLLMLGLSIMANHLSAIFLTKRREMTILRMISATPRQLRKMVVIQCGLFGMIGVVIGVVTGWITTYCLSQIDGGHVFAPIEKQGIVVVCVWGGILILSSLLGRKEAKAASEFQNPNIQVG